MSRDLSDNFDNLQVLIQRIEDGLKDRSYEDYLNDQDLQDATTYRLSMLGEITGKLPDDVKERHPGIPWNKIRGLRNVASHDYFSIMPDMVWEGTRSLEPIKQMIREELVRIEAEQRERDGGRRR
ncbi:MAG: DUF86 domain-containing protein [Caulobacter sp.]|nr:DUF86 domain-containing protein [Caulobacter sp.]